MIAKEIKQNLKHEKPSNKTNSLKSVDTAMQNNKYSAIYVVNHCSQNNMKVITCLYQLNGFYYI